MGIMDGKRGLVDVETGRIHAIELLPSPLQGDAPYRLHGTVRTRQGGFTGFVQWDRNDCVGTDELDGAPNAVRYERAQRSFTLKPMPTDHGATIGIDGTTVMLSKHNPIDRARTA